jgi:glycosyltransferase involved in cell wall biosynthesis
VLVCIPLPPWKTGGIEEVGYNEARALSRSCDVAVLTSGVGAPETIPNEPFRLVLLEGRVILERPLITRLRPLLREILWADAIHVHLPFPYIEVAVALMGKIAGKSVVLTYHMDAMSTHAEEGEVAGRLVEKAYDRLSLRPALTLAPRVASNTMSYVDWSRVLPRYRGKVTAIHQGIREDRVALADPAASRTRLLEKIGASPSVTLFGFVGRLVPYKGLHIAVPAFARVVKGGVDAHFVIGGTGPEREALGKMAATEGVADRVHFIGYVPDEDLASFYSGLDVFVCPSVSALESTAITLLEAMAQGTAVIGSEVGGTAETVPDGGLNRIVKGSDVEGLAGAMRALGDLARGRAKQPRYARTWDDVAEDYRELLFREGPAT